jgi:hypothetical protein
MKIALDYDGTVTEDPILWKTFVGFTKARGHDIRIVTFRSVDEITTDLLEFATNTGIEIMTTGRVWKQEYCIIHGWEPDVWIDDSPALINHDDGVWTQEQHDIWKKALLNRVVAQPTDTDDRSEFEEELAGNRGI